MTPRVAANRVKRGAAWLDEHYPDWLDRVNLDTLEMHDFCGCVVGQAARVRLPFGTWEDVMLVLGLTEQTATRLGFDAPTYPEYDDLEAAWTRHIEHRRSVEVSS